METATAHDWAAKLHDAHKARPDFVLFAYTRPDGSTATAFGGVYAMLTVEGEYAFTKLDYAQIADAEYPNNKLSGKVIDSIVTPGKPLLPAISFEVARLREACGEPPTRTHETGPLKCPECNGSGRVECPHCEQDMDCEECDGDGKVEQDEWSDLETRPIVIGELRFDTAVLASVLRAVPDGPVAAVFPAVGKPTRIDGAGWTMLAMPLTGYAEEGAIEPRFDLATK